MVLWEEARNRASTRPRTVAESVPSPLNTSALTLSLYVFLLRRAVAVVGGLEDVVRVGGRGREHAGQQAGERVPKLLVEEDGGGRRELTQRRVDRRDEHARRRGDDRAAEDERRKDEPNREEEPGGRARVGRRRHLDRVGRVRRDVRVLGRQRDEGGERGGRGGEDGVHRAHEEQRPCHLL